MVGGSNPSPATIKVKADPFEPLTQELLIARGQCCGSGCLLCPYVPAHRLGTIQLQASLTHLLPDGVPEDAEESAP
jgi:hypothetical protein